MSLLNRKHIKLLEELKDISGTKNVIELIHFNYASTYDEIRLQHIDFNDDVDYRLRIDRDGH